MTTSKKIVLLVAAAFGIFLAGFGVAVKVMPPSVVVQKEIDKDTLLTLQKSVESLTQQVNTMQTNIQEQLAKVTDITNSNLTQRKTIVQKNKDGSSVVTTTETAHSTEKAHETVAETKNTIEASTSTQTNSTKTNENVKAETHETDKETTKTPVIVSSRPRFLFTAGLGASIPGMIGKDPGPTILPDKIDGVTVPKLLDVHGAFGVRVLGPIYIDVFGSSRGALTVGIDTALGFGK